MFIQIHHIETNILSDQFRRRDAKVKPAFVSIFELSTSHIGCDPTSKFLSVGINYFKSVFIKLKIESIEAIKSLYTCSGTGRRPWRLSILSSSEIGFVLYSILAKLPESKLESIVTSFTCQIPFDAKPLLAGIDTNTNNSTEKFNQI